jgi:hypothetical protein
MPPNLRLVRDASDNALLPRGMAHGTAAWPKCLVCKRAVSAYGIADETWKYIEFWVRCDGIADPMGGQHARSYRAGIRIDKTRFVHGWTINSAADILARLALKPGKFAKWRLELGNPNSVGPR